ncbi:MAG: cytochrome c5 family protein [Usitatibacteraceae bacterium]
MSQSHHDPVEENLETHPVKLAIAVVVGAVGLIVGIVMLASYAVGSHSIGKTVDGANAPEAITQRIAPVTTLALDGAKAVAPGAAPLVVATTVAAAPIVAAAIPAATAASTPGAGVAGAPKTGDKAAWSARIAQGKPTLYQHALAGFQGKAGVMPAKGGNASLADADVKSAVDYMVSLAK